MPIDLQEGHLKAASILACWGCGTIRTEGHAGLERGYGLTSTPVHISKSAEDSDEEDGADAPPSQCPAPVASQAFKSGLF